MLNSAALGALRKFDSNGDLVWVKTIGINANDVGWRNNVVYVVGFSMENNKPLVWYDNAGTLLGSAGNSNNSYMRIALTN